MFRKLLVPLDRSPFAEQALGPATVIARAARAEIDLVMIHEPRPLAGSRDVARHAEQVDGEDEYLVAIAAELAKGASITTTRAVLPGEIVTAICNRARSVDADLVVMTSHGRTGLNRAWVGSVADGVLRRSGAPVLMCRPSEKLNNADPFLPFSHILVPLDGSTLAEGILQSAVSLAICTGARLSVLRIVQPVQLLTVETAIPFAFPLPVEDDISTKRLAERARRELSEVARKLADQSIGDVDSNVVIAHDVGQAIVDFALGSGIDVIAMSTHGRGASRLLFGSVADKIIRSRGFAMLLRGPAEVPNEFDAIDATFRLQHTDALST